MLTSRPHIPRCPWLPCSRSHPGVHSLHSTLGNLYIQQLIICRSPEILFGTTRGKSRGKSTHYIWHWLHTVNLAFHKFKFSHVCVMLPQYWNKLCSFSCSWKKGITKLELFSCDYLAASNKHPQGKTDRLSRGLTVNKDAPPQPMLYRH